MEGSAIIPQCIAEKKIIAIFFYLELGTVRNKRTIPFYLCVHIDVLNIAYHADHILYAMLCTASSQKVHV